MVSPVSDSYGKQSFDAFLKRYAEDRADGAVQPLTVYLDLFPDERDAIAREYQALQSAAEEAAFENFPEPDCRSGALHAAFANTHVLGTKPDHVQGGGAPESIGPYTIQGELGRGGQGIVYLAKDERLGRRVALKVLTRWGAASQAVVARFKREAAIASRLDHPNICTLYETGTADGVPYLAMRLLDGESLAQQITSGFSDPLPGPETFVEDVDPGDAATRDPASSNSAPPRSRPALTSVLRLIEKSARALQFAHDAGVIHRDVKPGNIMVTEGDEPVILDFGLARQADGDLETLTQTGDFFGTPAYMSPEQLASHCINVDERSDVYSLGVALYECLTLERPFDAPTRENLYHAILHQEAPDPRRKNPGVSRDMKVVLETAMAKDRERRYQTAAALADDLAAVRQGQPIAARAVGPVGKAVRWARRRPLAAACVALLVVGVPLVTALSGYIVATLPDVEAQRQAQRELALERALETGFFELHNGSDSAASADFT